MASSREEIAEVYEAAGYLVFQDTSVPKLVATRLSDTGQTEEVTVAFPLEARPRPDAASARSWVLSEIVTWRQVGYEGRIFVVALPSLLNLGAPFQTEAREAGAELRTYAFILDGGYGGGYIGLGREEAESAASKLRKRLFNYGRVDADLLQAVIRPNIETRALGEAPTRVQQRYFIRRGLSAADRLPAAGGDLLHHLVARLGQPASGPEVFLIVGAGGAGKSWLLEGLYTYLEEAFQRLKQKQEQGRRPIPVMPDSLIRAGARTTDDLFESVAETELGARAGLGLVDLLVTRGRAILLLDGLDEFFADNLNLQQSIAARYFTPGSKARIFIVLRDSLLETSENVKALVRTYGEMLGPDQLTIYELARWEPDFAQRELAWIKLEKRRPNPGEADTERVKSFRAWLAGLPRLQELAGVAFYCDLLVDLWVDYETAAAAGDAGDEATATLGVETRSGRPMPQDEYDVLGLCFDLIVDRELAKQRPDPEQQPEKAFLPAPEETPAESAMDSLRRLFQLGPRAWLSSVEAADPRSMASGVEAPEDRALLEGRYGLVRLIEEAAYFVRRQPGATGITAGTLRLLYDRMELGVTEADRDLGERMLRQFVLFEQGGESGTVDFTHEFMADFLAARHVLAMHHDGRGRVRELMGAPARGETEVFRGYLARELGDGFEG